MYSKELRMRAIELYIKYEKSPADVIRELGYPDRKMLGKWYKMYLEEQETGVPYEKRYAKVPRFSQEEQEAAARHYLEHGRNYSRTVRALGYPNRETLRLWCKELVPDMCKKRSDVIRYVHGQKEETTGTFRSRETNDKEAIRMVSHKRKPLLPDKEAQKHYV